MDPVHYRLNDLALWRTQLPGVETAILPPLSDASNPRLHGRALFVSVFYPGCVHALEADTGKIIWSLPLPSMGHASIEIAGGLLLAGTAQMLQAIEPETGTVRWEFCPYGKEGERIYSRPMVAGQRLFLGDRRGWLHCLSLETGETLWKQLTPGDGRRDVNATAAIFDGLVVGANNAGVVFAYSAGSGELVWQTQLDGPVGRGLFLMHNHIVAATDSLFLIDPGTGEIRASINWTDRNIWCVSPCGSYLAVLRGHVYHEGEPLNLEKDLLLIDNEQGVNNLPCSEHASSLRWNRATGLLYACGFAALDLLHPQTGEWLSSIGFEDLSLEDHDIGGAVPEVADGRIYLLSMQGALLALRHP